MNSRSGLGLAGNEQVSGSGIASNHYVPSEVPPAIAGQSYPLKPGRAYSSGSYGFSAF